ncbi:hypothetical protein KI688_010537 [Linnemannia hyalina]|uniref:Uncharacterized protein n=1 Tax=Linnemannia hyalina TaxID=64524 RepID=A0A9P7XZR6_9FUNG|nr:hypothetical protein KI688_010537 [Linnemannia hyalina]
MILAAVAVLVLYAPSVVFALVGISWNATDGPSYGLKDVTFPFSISQTPHKSGYYFAQQFGFIGQSDVGYAGLQPRPDSGGKPIIHAVFSSFASGTTTNDPNCAPGADGGPGVSCSVEFSAPYSNGFNLVVQNTVGTTWMGTSVDTTTGSRVHVGTWTLPSGTQGIANSQVGFVEYYLWNDGQQHACSSLPYTWVTFGTPTSTTSGVNFGLSNAFEYGDCVGKVAFKNPRTSGGVQVQIGF